MRQIIIAWFLTMLAGSTIAETPLHLHSGGRVHKATDGGFAYDWTGTYFEARFKGPELILTFDDPSNIFQLYIDEKPVRRFEHPGTATITLNNLGKGPHFARLERLTETTQKPDYKRGRFLGFSVPAKRNALTVTARKRQIEIIGDSSATGYAVTSTKRNCTAEEVWATTDSQQSYGALTAKSFDADYQINAYSGRGIIRNGGGVEPDLTLPLLYPYVLFDKQTPVSHKGWQPQIIVFSIFGNDFSPLSPTEKWKSKEDIDKDFEPAYVAFIKSVRAKNPKAAFIFMMPTTEEWLDGYKAIATQAGEPNAAFVAAIASVDELERTACHWHASPNDTQKHATALSDYITAHPELWQGQ